jgi:hypothetical protein
LGEASTDFANRRTRACSQGRTVDSVYITRAAAETIDGSSDRLEVLTYSSVVAPGPIEEGVLVRLVPRGGRVLGLGGLVYVDIESGCAIALKRYE